MAAEVDSPVSPSEHEKLTGKQGKLQDTVFGKVRLCCASRVIFDMNELHIFSGQAMVSAR